MELLGSLVTVSIASKCLIQVSQDCRDRHWICLRYHAGRATNVEMLGTTLVSLHVDVPSRQTR